jgi:hypothetical protein
MVPTSFFSAGSDATGVLTVSARPSAKADARSRAAQPHHDQQAPRTPPPRALDRSAFGAAAAPGDPHCAAVHSAVSLADDDHHGRADAATPPTPAASGYTPLGMEFAHATFNTPPRLGVALETRARAEAREAFDQRAREAGLADASLTVSWECAQAALDAFAKVWRRTTWAAACGR